MTATHSWVCTDGACNDVCSVDSAQKRWYFVHFLTYSLMMSLLESKHVGVIENIQCLAVYLSL
jgi:hypothetical protein